MSQTSPAQPVAKLPAGSPIPAATPSTPATPATPDKPNLLDPTAATPPSPATTPPTTTELDSPEGSPSPDATQTKPADGPAAEKPGETDLGGADPAPDEPPANPYLGAPAEGEDYTAPVIPDGVQMDAGRFSEFTPLAREIGLSQAGVEKLIDFQVASEQARATAWGNHTSELREAARADPEIGGPQYQTETMPAARAAIDKFGTPAFRAMLNQYGVGNHPEMIRFCRAVGLATREATATPGSAPQQQPSLTRAQKFYGPKE